MEAILSPRTEKAHQEISIPGVLRLYVSSFSLSSYEFAIGNRLLFNGSDSKTGFL